MQLLVFSAVFVSALAIPHGHHHHSSHSHVGSSYQKHHNEETNADRLGGTYGVPSTGYGHYSVVCHHGKILDGNGKCVQPIVDRSFYRYIAPKRNYHYGSPPHIPKPKLNHNVVLIETPEAPKPLDPIVVPPAEEQTVVYVLSKDEKPEPRKIIQIPDQERKPIIHYINVEDGEDIQLPDGIDLESAFNVANKRQGKFIHEDEELFTDST